MLAASLQSFMPQPQPINLRGANGEESLSLPISPRLQIRRAVLHLFATNSLSLLSPRSQLQVRLDGKVVAQIALDPKLPQIQAQIDLPVRLLTTGYHSLTFAVAQHYTNDCEDPSAAELWTQIDTAQSWIALDASLRDVHPTLAKLPVVFDPKLWGSHTLTILAAGGVDAAVLRWGALASQAVALYLGYAPLQVRFAQAQVAAQAAPGDTALRLHPSLVAQGDAVLVGTREALRPYLSDALAARITGPFLAIEPLNANTGRYVLIASGLSAGQVDVALRTANLLDYPYPDTVDAVVKSLELPALPDNPGPRMVYPNQAVPFSRLGFRTANFSGMYGQKELEFTLPPDLFAPDNAFVHLKLRFAYGAGLREDSVLNVLLNGRFQSAIALSARNGGYFRDYDVAIPLTSFKPGRNVLTFSAAMMPLITGRCIAINTDNLRLTLFADSRLELPDAAHIAALPNLDLFARTGFPYTHKAYGAGDVFAIARADGAQAAAAWMLAAKLAQVQKLPLLDARWQIGTAGLSTQDNAAVVGLPSDLPDDLRRALPLRFGATSASPYPLAVSAEGPGTLGLLGRLWRRLGEKFQISAPPGSAHHGLDPARRSRSGAAGGLAASQAARKRAQHVDRADSGPPFHSLGADRCAHPTRGVEPARWRSGLVARRRANRQPDGRQHLHDRPGAVWRALWLPAVQASLVLGHRRRRFGSPARRADLAAAAAFLSSPPRPQTAPDRRPAAVGLMRHDRTDVAHITV